MNRWYEDCSNGQDVIVASRLRLARNFKNHLFPSKLSEEESEKLLTEVMNRLHNISTVDGKKYEALFLNDMNEVDRLSLKERRAIHSDHGKKKQPAGLILSEDEGVSLVINGDDHIRLQLLKTGDCLKEMWKSASEIDDYINEQYEYAFDKKYGYLTTFPTNLGTGMRASLTLHLPALACGNNFRKLAGDMGRFGINIRGIFGEGRDNYGFLYEISNQKTLGQSEENIIDVVERIAGQLVSQEKKIRKMSFKEHKLEQVDEIYKSIGVLKYARQLSLKETMIYLSHLMIGIAEGFIKVPETFNTYKLILGILPANIQKLADKPLTQGELNIARADFVRAELPNII